MHRFWRGHVLGRLERELPLLRGADEYDALGGSKPRSIACRDVILALTTLELNDGNAMPVGK